MSRRPWRPKHPCYCLLHEFQRAGLVQSVYRLDTGWTVLESNLGGDEIFRIRPNRLWGPTSFLYKGYRVFPGVKRPGCGVDHAHPSSAEVKERVELYIYSPLWAFVAYYRVKFTFLPLHQFQSSRDLREHNWMVWYSNIFFSWIQQLFGIKASNVKS